MKPEGERMSFPLVPQQQPFAILLEARASDPENFYTPVIEVRGWQPHSTTLIRKLNRQVPAFLCSKFSWAEMDFRFGETMLIIYVSLQDKGAMVEEKPNLSSIKTQPVWKAKRTALGRSVLPYSG